MKPVIPTLLFLLGLAMPATIRADEVRVTTASCPVDAAFHLLPLSPAAVRDAGSAAVWTLVDGAADPNSPGLAVLHDDRLPTNADEPGANFFFKEDGGRLVVDLGAVIPLVEINTYSWHTGERAPQVYNLYGATG